MYILLRSVNLRLSVLILSPVLCTTTLLALGERPTEDETNSLKQLSLAELGNLQVTMANKTPLAGNYWEVQDTVMQDIDRSAYAQITWQK